MAQGGWGPAKRGQCKPLIQAMRKMRTGEEVPSTLQQSHKPMAAIQTVSPKKSSPSSERQDFKLHPCACVPSAAPDQAKSSSSSTSDTSLGCTGSTGPGVHVIRCKLSESVMLWICPETATMFPVSNLTKGNKIREGEISVA